MKRGKIERCDDVVHSAVDNIVDQMHALFSITSIIRNRPTPPHPPPKKKMQIIIHIPSLVLPSKDNILDIFFEWLYEYFFLPDPDDTIK